jgi:tRNA (guanine26-N2/guanine27-N2)-dimethyltransferase
MWFKKKDENKASEEDVIIKSYGSKISKELTVFYNPLMKLNRDISLLVIKSYFEKPIKFCDPMVASGIREIRFLKTIPEMFEKLVLGDISKTAIKNVKKNFKLNKVSLKKVSLINTNALNTISSEFFNFIEIDPFGSPVPFLDIACQRIKHNGILSITATDTAALCGTYPKTTLRKYGIKVIKTHFHEELGLRNLIAYCQRQGAKYEKALIPILSYSKDHYFKIFFKVEDSRTSSLQILKELRYIKWDKKTQDVTINEFEDKDSLGKTYIGPLCNKNFLKEVLSNIKLIKEVKKPKDLIEKLLDEIEIIGSYNPHKLQKEFKFASSVKFEDIINSLKEKGFKVSRPHNNRLGIKTNAKSKEILKVMKI